MPRSAYTEAQRLFKCLKKDKARNGVSASKYFLSLFLPTGFNALIWLRIFEWLDSVGLPTAPARFYLRLVHSVQIYGGTCIGGGVYLPHPHGVGFGKGTRIGENCDIYGEVVFLHYRGRGPKIGDKCKFGNGCRILGKVTLATGTKIAPGAVVFSSTERENATLWGNPARNVFRRH